MLLLSSLAFLPAVRQGFVMGDDDYNLVVNPHWRGLGMEQLRWMWSSFHYGHWHPLTWMSFGLEHELWGVDAGRMHAVNLALHALSALLVFQLLLRLLGAGLGARADARPQALAWAAALGALLWAAHPLRVESVAWATERRDLLSGLFLLATVLAWLRWVAGEGRAWLVVALSLYALSLLSKAWGMTLPVLLLLVDVYPLRRLEAAGGGARGLLRLALEKWPFVPLAAATAALAALAQAGATATVTLADHGAAARTAQAAYGLLWYPWKTLVPTRLSTLYLLERDLDPTRAVYLACALGVVALTAAAWALRRRAPALLTCWAAYALLVSPVLGFLQSGGQKVADRYGYLAAIPLGALVASGLFPLLADQRRRKAVLACGALVLVALGTLSWRQTLVWGDSLTLWSRAAQLEPDNYVAHLNVAATLRQRGRPGEALARARRSVEAEPGRKNVYARFFVGLLLLEQGDFEGALRSWREALALAPSDLMTLSVASGELAQRGRSDEALALLQAGHAAAPLDLEVAALLAGRLAADGNALAAERVWRRGLAGDPGWVEGRVGLARALVARSALQAAERELTAALDLDPGRVDALLLLGRVLRALGRVAEAEACWSQVLEQEPGNEEASGLLRKSRAAGAGGR